MCAMSVRRHLLNDLTIPEDAFPRSPDLFLYLLRFMKGSSPLWANA